MFGQNRFKTAGSFALLLTMLFVLVRTAWIGDDAAITLRSVLNFVHGYGATFNIDERVQSFTHPLWFLLISALTWLIQNVHTATFLLSIVLSMAVFWLLLARLATGFWSGVLAAAILLFSKAYIDFSASGLENPLSHLLIIGCVLSGIRAMENLPGQGGLARFSCLLLAALLYLSRPDLLLLIASFVLLVLYRAPAAPARLMGELLVASLPVLAWTGFSLFYYGFPFPNTAYAKLGTGIPLLERIAQGGVYLWDSLTRDAVTMPAIVLALWIGLRTTSTAAMLALGMGLYLLYVVSIGGDFMSGRFLTAPLLVAAILVARTDFPGTKGKSAVVVMAVLGTINAQATLLSDADYRNATIPPSGIADERGFYFPAHGLISAKPGRFDAPDWKATGRKRVEVIYANLGFYGIAYGPDVHIVDTCALADPLLARLSAKHTVKWRIGHFVRQLPTDYVASLQQGRNVLADRTARAYYQSIRKITRAPIFEPDRVSEILRMNLGLIAAPDMRLYRSGIVPWRSSARLVRLDAEERLQSGDVGWHARHAIPFANAIEIALPYAVGASSLEVTLRADSAYRLEAQLHGVYFPVLEIPGSTEPGMRNYVIGIDGGLRYDRLMLTAADKPADGQHVLANLRIIKSETKGAGGQ